MHGNISKSKGGSANSLKIENGKVYAVGIDKQIELSQAYQTYGVSIDLTNSNPESAVTYTDDAVGMVAGSRSWYEKSIFRNIRPCLLQAGTVIGYLNPNDFSQFVDGSPADIITADKSDVMIEIPKTGYRIAKSGNTLTVQITDDPDKPGFCYLAHTRDKEGDRRAVYIGAFLGYLVADSMLYSLSGKTPETNASFTHLRSAAKARGSGYDLLSFYPLTLIQCLYLIIKTLTPRLQWD